MSDGFVKIDTEIDDKGFEKSLEKLKKSFNSFTADLGSNTTKIINKMKSIGSTIVVSYAAISTAAVAASAAMAGWAKKAAEVGDRVDKLSQKMNLSRKGFQELDYIAEQNGTTLEALSMSMKTLAVQAEADGKVFEKLGINVKDAGGALKDQETLFNETLNVLFSMENQTERLALASKLFGRGAQELAPILNAGADGFEELRQRAHDLGLVLSDEAIDASVRFGDTLDDLSKSFKMSLLQAIYPVIPQIEQFYAKLIEATKVGGSLYTTIQNIATGLVKFATTVIPPILKSIEYLIGHFEELIAVYAALRLGVLALNLAMAANPFGAIAALIAAVIVPALILLYKNFEKVKLYGQLSAQVIEVAFVKLGAFLINSLLVSVQKVLQVFQKIPLIGKQFDDAVSSVQGMRNAIDTMEQSSENAIVKTLQQIDALDKLKETTDEVATSQNKAAQSYSNFAQAIENAETKSLQERLDGVENTENQIYNTKRTLLAKWLLEQADMEGVYGQQREEFIRAQSQRLIDERKLTNDELVALEDAKELAVRGKYEETNNQQMSFAESFRQSLENMANSTQDLFAGAFASILQGFEDIGQAIVNGELGWETFAKAGIEAVAALVDALATQLLAQAAIAFISSDPVEQAKAPYALAQAAALKVAAGVLKATAGKFAHGGIVPGNSYTGDRLLAGVNSGELILNEAQQGTLAKTLTALNTYANNNGGGNGNLVINVINNAGVDVGVSENTNGDERMLDIIIEKKVTEFLGSPRGGAFMGNTFGLNQLGRKCT